MNWRTRVRRATCGRLREGMCGGSGVIKKLAGRGRSAAAAYCNEFVVGNGGGGSFLLPSIAILALLSDLASCTTPSAEMHQNHTQTNTHTHINRHDGGLETGEKFFAWCCFIHTGLVLFPQFSIIRLQSLGQEQTSPISNIEIRTEVFEVRLLTLCHVTILLYSFDESSFRPLFNGIKWMDLKQILYKLWNLFPLFKDLNWELYMYE